MYCVELDLKEKALCASWEISLAKTTKRFRMKQKALFALCASWEISPTKTTKRFRMKEKVCVLRGFVGNLSHKDNKEIPDEGKGFVCFVTL